uniref:PTS ascorbate transporter subunit IIB n=1 Tax=Raoultella ornithinolytica TaxID=54291 RepID=UPI002012E47C
IIDKHGCDIELEQDVLYGLRTCRDIYFDITMRDLTEEVEDAGFNAIGITDLMNSEEMESALIRVIQHN